MLLSLAVVLMLAQGGPATEPQDFLHWTPRFDLTRVDELMTADYMRRLKPRLDPAKAGVLAKIVVQQAKAQDLDPDFVAAIAWIETRFDPSAVSSKGAKGLMQLMPGTARDLGVQDPFDPAASVAGAARYLRQLSDMFGGNLVKVAAAYNAGPRAVIRWRGVPPYRETRGYVRRLAEAYFRPLPVRFPHRHMWASLP